MLTPVIHVGDLEIRLVHRRARVQGRDLRLIAEEFAEVGAEIVRALDSFTVPEQETRELVDAYMTAMPQVVRLEP